MSELKPKPILNSPPRREPSAAVSPTSPEKTVPAAPSAKKADSSNAKPRDLDRRRAAVAWQHIQTVKPQSYQAKYGSLARRLPTLIQVNGLAQTLAFLKAKGKENDPKSRKEHFVQAFYHLSNWLCDRFDWGETDLLTKVLAQNMDSQRYRLATSEALAFLNWLKRFAEAELGSEEES
jgi:CRISPR-associated protein Cmr5